MTEPLRPTGGPSAARLVALATVMLACLPIGCAQNEVPQPVVANEHQVVAPAPEGGPASIGAKQGGLRVPVDCLVFTADGKALAANFNDLVQIWDAVTWEPRLKLTAPSSVYALAWSPDGKFLAAACRGKTVEVWDAAGQPQKSLTGFKAPPTALAWSPNGKVLAVAAGDPNPYSERRKHVRSEVRLFDPADGKLIGELSDPGDTVHALAFSADGTTLAGGCNDAKVRLWDVAQRKQRGAPLSLGQAPALGLGFSDDGRLLAACGMDGAIALWDAADWKEQRRMQAKERVNSIALADSGRFIITGEEDGSVRLWEPLSGEQKTALLERGPRVYAVAAQPGGDAVACGGAEGVVRVWELAPGNPQPRLLQR
jgi:WD40 repeat protein